MPGLLRLSSTVGTILVFISSAGAHASDAGDELTVGSTKPQGATSSSDTSTFISDAVIASFDIGEEWALDPGLIVSRSANTVASPTGGPPTKTVENQLIVSLLGSYAPTESWLFFGSLKYSPPATQRTSLCLPRDLNICGAGTQAISMFSIGATAAYDTEGDRAFEWGAYFNPSATFYGMRFALDAYPDRPKTSALQQYQFAGGVTAHFLDTVDVNLKGAYFYYADKGATDPDVLVKDLGIVSGGLPIAPMQWNVGPGVTVFFTHHYYLAFTTLAGPYLDPCEGTTLLGSLKFTARPSRLRLWASLTLQLDTPPQDAATVELNRCNGTSTDGTATPPSVSTYVAAGAEFVW
jgi:hypothetical protein